MRCASGPLKSQLLERLHNTWGLLGFVYRHPHSISAAVGGAYPPLKYIVCDEITRIQCNRASVPFAANDCAISLAGERWLKSSRRDTAQVVGNYGLELIFHRLYVRKHRNKDYTWVTRVTHLSLIHEGRPNCLLMTRRPYLLITCGTII